MQRLSPYFEEVNLEKGHVIFEAGGHVEHVYFPVDCMVSVVGYDSSGETIEAATIGWEGTFGALQGLGTGRARNEHIVQAAGLSVRMPLQHFKAAVVSDAGVRHMHDRSSEAMLEHVVQSLVCLGCHSAEARLCRWVLMAHDQIGNDTLLLTQEFLSQMLGVHRPSVSLIARTLQSAGLIRYARGRITILDRPGLEDSSCDCYAAVKDVHRKAFGDKGQT